MLYDLAKGPPEPGTLLEALFTMVWQRRQTQRLLETRVLVEAVLRPHMEKDTLTEALGNYVDSLFPYLAKKSTAKKADMRKTLSKWVKTGPKRVVPLWMTKRERVFKSRMKARLKEIRSGKAKRRGRGVRL